MALVSKQVEFIVTGKPTSVSKQVEFIVSSPQVPLGVSKQVEYIITYTQPLAVSKQLELIVVMGSLPASKPRTQQNCVL